MVTAPPQAECACPRCGSASLPTLSDEHAPVPAGLDDFPATVLRPALAAQHASGRLAENSFPATQCPPPTGGRTLVVRQGWPELPGYEMLEELGRGGMGVVYKARQTKLNRVVALKMILAGKHADDAERARFRQEALAVSRLQHPNIVQIFDFGDHEGSSWFSLEFVEGGTLAERLRQQPPPLTEAAQLVQTVARAVHFAHERGVIHRDLKPANILLHTARPDGDSARAAPAGRLVPKVADFGLAKDLDADVHNTRSGMVVGTPSYMAPEQARLGTAVGPAADVWALGVMLYQMVTGKLPFTGESVVDVLMQVTQAEPLPPSRHAPRLPRDLETIILKCLEKAPQRRYHSAGELADDLARFLAHEPILARPVGGLELALRWARRRPATSALLAVAALALLGLVGALAWQWRAEARDREKALEEAGLTLHQARGAAKEGEWDKVRSLLGPYLRPGAIDRLAPDQREAIEALVAELGAREAMREFRLARDEALFHDALAANRALPRKTTRDKVARALRLVGAEGGKPPRPHERASRQEKEELLHSCYELLMVLADSEARPLPRQAPAEARQAARRGLAKLDEAARLGVKTGAWHLRRARYLRAAGEFGPALAEEALASGMPPASALDHYLTGAEYYRRGELAQAGESFGEALARQPEHYWARYFGGLCHLGLEQYQQARDHFSTCISKRPQIVWSYLLRGYTLGQMGRSGPADRDFDAALRLLRKAPDPDALYVLHNDRAVLYLRQMELKKARQELEDAIRLLPGPYQAHVNLCHVLEQMKEPALALKALGRGLDCARSSYERKELHGTVLRKLYGMRAHMRRKAKDLDGALADLALALKLDGLTPKARAGVHRDRGHFLLHAGKPGEAEAEYLLALALTPEDPGLWRWHGDVQLRLPRPAFAKAEASYTRALSRSRNAGPYLYSQRALARHHLGNVLGEIDDLSAALDRPPPKRVKGQPPTPAPSPVSLRLRRAQAYLRAEAWQLAEADFTWAISNTSPLPRDIGPSCDAMPRGRGLALWGRGLARLHRKQYRGAYEDAKKASALKGLSPAQSVRLAALFAQLAGQLASHPREASYCRDRGGAMLRQAFADSPRAGRPALWRTVQNEPALRPLHTHPDYLALKEAHGEDARR